MDTTDVQAWIDGYLQAWNSNEPKAIRRLFHAQAEYFTAPYRIPWRGHEEIVAGWLARADHQGNWDFNYEVVAQQANLFVVEGVTQYHDQGRFYSNLWLIWLGSDGRCTKFVEYFMLQQD